MSGGSGPTAGPGLYKYLGAAEGDSLLSDPPAGEDLFPAMLYPPPSHPSGHANLGWGVRRNCRHCYPFFERELAASGRRRALYQYKYFIPLGRESFFSDPPARKDLLPGYMPSPPPILKLPGGEGLLYFEPSAGSILL